MRFWNDMARAVGDLKEFIVMLGNPTDGEAQYAIVADLLSFISTKDKGYFANEDELNEAYPNPQIGDWAIVGGYIFRCIENGIWVNTDTKTPEPIYRRISIEMQSNEQKIPLGEETTIYNVWAVNANKLEVSIDGGSTFDEIPLDGSSISYVIPEKTVAVFRAEQQTVDTDMSLYIYAKAKVQ